MSEAISRGTKQGMRRYYLRVPRCKAKGCRVYVIKDPFSLIRRCAKHSLICTSCENRYPEKRTCVRCRSYGRIPTND